MSSSTRAPRPLDHLVLPVTDIKTARERLTRLGFSVAADARHPFGTENACVYFSDKSYLEPLGLASQDECREAVRAGNQFVARDQAFRFRHGPEGLSAIAMGSDDADGDDARFRANAMSSGELLTFSRQMKLPDGSEVTANFKLAFATDLRSPDFHDITCQRINMPPVDRSALERHPNGVKAISEVILSEPDPEDFRFYLGEIVSQDEAILDEAGMELQSANAIITVLNPDGMMALFGMKASCHSRGLRGRAVIFKVSDLAATESLFKTNGVEFTFRDNRLLVPHEEGQSVLFAFEE
jgi:hypothetical protein